MKCWSWYFWIVCSWRLLDYNRQVLCTLIYLYSHVFWQWKEKSFFLENMTHIGLFLFSDLVTHMSKWTATDKCCGLWSIFTPMFFDSERRKVLSGKYDTCRSFSIFRFGDTWVSGLLQTSAVDFDLFILPCFLTVKEEKRFLENMTHFNFQIWWNTWVSGHYTSLLSISSTSLSLHCQWESF